MELLVLNEGFQTVYILDKYESLIWTDRFSKYGDFEIYTLVDQDIVKNLKQDYYIWSDHSDHVMIIEERKIDADVENGNHFTITGRSLESILERRIIWNQTDLDGYIQDEIERLLNDNIINPSDQNRRISNFIFEKTDDISVTSVKIKSQFSGENLYDAIQKLCESVNIGFKITLNGDNQFVFKLYSGKNRSYDQNTNPYVVFSPNFENIISSNYYESKKKLKTITLVAGEGEGSNRKTLEIGDANLKDLYRRELYTDGRDISSTDSEGNPIDASAYEDLLRQRGLEKLSENKLVQTFDGQVEASRMFCYEKDFFMGDITQLENEYGMSSKVRVIEFIYSEDENGIETYPTFEVIEESIIYDPYTGKYVITPLFGSDIALPTRNRIMEKNVIVEEIPYYETPTVGGGTTVYIGMEEVK